MKDETENTKGRDLLKRLADDPDSGITLEDGLTQAQVEKLVKDIDSHYGRVIKGYTENIKDLTRENEGYKSDIAEVHKTKRETKAAELEKATGVKASLILKHGGETLKEMEEYAKETAEELGIKPPESKDDKKSADDKGDSSGDKKGDDVEKKDDKGSDAEGDKTGDNFELDSNQTVGSGEPTQEQLSNMPTEDYVKWREAQENKK